MDHFYPEFEAKHLDRTSLLEDEQIRNELSASFSAIVDTTKNLPSTALSLLAKPIRLSRDIITYRRELREIFQGLGLQGKKTVITRVMNVSPFGSGSFKMLSESVLGRQRISRVPIDYNTLGGKAHTSSGVLGLGGNLLIWSTLYQIYCETGELSRPAWDHSLVMITGAVLGKMGRSGHITSLHQEFKDRPLSIDNAADLYRKKHNEDPTYIYKKFYAEYKEFMAYRNKTLGLVPDQSPLSIAGLKTMLTTNNKAAQTLGLDLVPFLAAIKQLSQAKTGKEWLTGKELSERSRKLQFFTGSSRSLAYLLGFITSIQAVKDGVDPEAAGQGAITFALWFLGQTLFIRSHISRSKENTTGSIIESKHTHNNS